MIDADIAPVPIALDRLLAGFTAEGVECAQVAIRGLHLDSRKVQSGDLFVALQGQQLHGLTFAPQAVEQGCAAIIYDPAGEGDRLALTASAVPCVPVTGLNRKLGFIADRFFREPSRDLPVIGITGTNGKTSCSHFLAAALTQPGKPAAVIGTLGWGEPGSLAPTSHTTPDAIDLQSMLNSLRQRGCGYVAMEASSHGLDQGRLEGVRFRGALYTNFSRDHLDYHGSMQAYLEAKLRLLAVPSLEFVVCNADSEIAPAVLEHRPPQLPTYGFTLMSTSTWDGPMLRLAGIRRMPQGVAFQAEFGGRSLAIESTVFGDFNVENLAATLAVLLAMGMDLDQAAERMRRVRPVPGRMESHVAAGRTVVVDYAHTPDALSKVLRSLRRHSAGRLWVVFGCGGDRDRGKRPQMGRIADDLADEVVLTDDNPRFEDGGIIIEDILSGCRPQRATIIRDRRQAIAHALHEAAAGDVVLIAGKGHESTQEVCGVKTPFSDSAVVRDILGASKA